MVSLLCAKSSQCMSENLHKMWIKIIAAKKWSDFLPFTQLEHQHSDARKAVFLCLTNKRDAREKGDKEYFHSSRKYREISWDDDEKFMYYIYDSTHVNDSKNSSHIHMHDEKLTLFPYLFWLYRNFPLKISLKLYEENLYTSSQYQDRETGECGKELK